MLTDEEMAEASQLAKRFQGVRNRAEFARTFGVPGGGAMIYQHIKGLKPISLDAAKAYARGFQCSLNEISERLAQKIGTAALLVSMPEGSGKAGKFLAKLREKNHENQPALLPKSNTQTSQSGGESTLSVREPAARVIRLVSAMDAAGKFTEELADAIERVIHLQTPIPATTSLDTAGAALALAKIADRFAGKEMLPADKLQHLFMTLIKAQRAELALEAKQQKTETVNHEEK